MLITNEAHSTKLVIIISHFASLNRIIDLVKTHTKNNSTMWFDNDLKTKKLFFKIIYTIT